jgi:hypothetical protein
MTPVFAGGDALEHVECLNTEPAKLVCDAAR